MEADVTAVKSTSFQVGLIGGGIMKSRSPAIHMAEGEALGLDVNYHLFDLDLDPRGHAALPKVLEEVQAQGFAGVNVTYPFKQEVMALLDELSPDARALKAVNTVVLKNGRRIGYNTDWTGFGENLKRGLPDVRMDSVLQLGAGGAGSAITYALLKLGVKQIFLSDLDSERAERLVQTMAEAFGPGRVTICDNLAQAAAQIDGLVNATPVGMLKHPGTPLPASLLRPQMWVADVVYVPLETELLKSARAIGCKTLDGGGMAVLQAAEAFRLFTGVTPNIERMLSKFNQSLLSGEVVTSSD